MQIKVLPRSAVIEDVLITVTTRLSFSASTEVLIEFKRREEELRGHQEADLSLTIPEIIKKKGKLNERCEVFGIRFPVNYIDSLNPPWGPPSPRQPPISHLRWLKEGGEVEMIHKITFYFSSDG